MTQSSYNSKEEQLPLSLVTVSLESVRRSLAKTPKFSFVANYQLHKTISPSHYCRVSLPGTVFANQLCLRVIHRQVRMRPLLRFTEEWTEAMAALERLARRDATDLLDVYLARIDAFRAYPLLAVCEYVTGGSTSNFDNFASNIRGVNPFVPAGVGLEPLQTPRNREEQDILTRQGWKMLYDIGFICAYFLFINNEDSIPIAHVWLSGKPKNLFIDPRDGAVRSGR